MVVVVIPGGAATWRVLPVDAAGSRTALLDGLPCPGAIARASGGFFAAHQGGHAPRGLAVGDGVALSPFSPRRWGGVLVRRGGESAILPLAAFPADGVWDQALQSSPILVADGANDMLRDDGQLDNRLAVALDGAGGLALVGAFRDGGGAVSLHSFAELLLALAVEQPIAQLGLAHRLEHHAGEDRLEALAGGFEILLRRQARRVARVARLQLLLGHPPDY